MKLLFTSKKLTKMFSEQDVGGQREVILKHLNEIKQRSTYHNRRSLCLKRTHDIIEIVQSILNAIAICILISFEIRTLNSLTIIVAAITSSVAFCMNSAKLASNITMKYTLHFTHAKQYSDLDRYITMNLTRPFVSSDDISTLLNEIINRLNIISDNETYRI